MGRSRGLPAQHEGENPLTIDQVRDRSGQGVAPPTLMDYSRFNYVAHPRQDRADRICSEDGPYDKWATMWGTSRFAEKTPEAENARARSMGARAG